MIRGIIFDLDGTLIDSQLDFEAMRREMELPVGQPILEAIESMETSRAAMCREILSKHERLGAQLARPIEGVINLLDELASRTIRMAIITRNSRSAASAMLAHLPSLFDPVICREDGPVKPDPWAVNHICAAWQLKANQVAFIGDFRFDMEAGHSAGAMTVLFTRGRDPKTLAGADLADMTIDSFRDTSRLITAIGNDIAD